MIVFLSYVIVQSWQVGQGLGSSVLQRNLSSLYLVASLGRCLGRTVQSGFIRTVVTFHPTGGGRGRPGRAFYPQGGDLEILPLSSHWPKLGNKAPPHCRGSLEMQTVAHPSTDLGCSVIKRKIERMDTGG